MNKKTLTVATVVTAVGLVLFGGFFYLNKGPETAKVQSAGDVTSSAGTNFPEAPTNTPTGGLGGQVYSQVSTNPVQGNIPETNPFTAGANPYSDSYKNPFGQ